jgi:hypothetical protein
VVLREHGLTDGQAASFADFYMSALDLLGYYDEHAG